MEKIRKVSSYLLIIFNISLLIVPLAIAVQWVLIDAKGTNIYNALNPWGFLNKTFPGPEGHIDLSMIHWTKFSKILGFCADILASLYFIISLFVLKAIFKNYRKGEVFSIINAAHYKTLGWLFFLDATIINPLSGMLMTLAVTINNPPGYRYISIGFTTVNLKTLFCGILIIVLSWAMREASKLHEEQKFTV